MTTKKTIQEYGKSLCHAANFTFSPQEEFKKLLEEYGNQRYEEGKAEQKKIDAKIAIRQKVSMDLAQDGEDEFIFNLQNKMCDKISDSIINQ
jgi:hypothetical protein